MAHKPDIDATKIIFVIAIIAAIISIFEATSLPGTALINEPNNDYPLIPRYVILFSVIGALMYFFASTAGEWIEKVDELKGNVSELDAFNKKPFFDKLKYFDLGRKSLRVIAAPLMAIGIYLLFDLIFFDMNITTEQQASNVSLMNSTLQDMIKAIETTNNTEKIILIKAGISFLAGAFVKQFLDLIGVLVNKIGK